MRRSPLLAGKMDQAVKLAALFGVVAIGVLSLVPGSIRPHVLASGGLEHLAAYLAVGFLFGLAYLRPRRLLLLAASLSAYAGLLEVAQNFVPGRHPAVGDFIVSSAGAWIGIALASMLTALSGVPDFSREEP